MKKAATSKNFSETKAKVKDFGKSSHSKSDVDLSEIGKSCSDLRGMYERGDAFNREVRRDSVFDDDELAQFNTADKRSAWEANLTNSNRIVRSSTENITERIESINKMKELFEKGQVSKNDLQSYIDSRSVVRNDNDSGDKHLTVQEELEELRQSAKLKSMFRLERGKSDNSNLRRTNSLIGVTGERITNDLDDEVMAEVSVTNKMVKAMFEQNAPKYKFGGSGSKLDNNSGSSENVAKPGPVTRPSVKPKEERKWVLDTINKYFDVIVEEEEEEEEYEEDEEDEDDYESEYSEYEDEEDIDMEDTTNKDNWRQSTDNFQSTNKMRGLLSSVVTKISGSVGNLAQKDLIQSLKQNLGSQINMRNSNTNLTST